MKNLWPATLASLLLLTHQISLTQIKSLPVTIKAFPDLTLKDQKTFENFTFDNSKWEFAVLPKPDTNECYIRLGYWFDREGLLQFDIDQKGRQGSATSFIIYVGPEHPLKLLDLRVPNKSETGKFCEGENYFAGGMDAVLEYFNKHLTSKDTFNEYLDRSISQGAINIAAPLEDYTALYSKIWSNVVDMKQEEMDKLMWKNDDFAQEHYPAAYLEDLARQISQTFKQDFLQFFRRKQTEEAEQILKHEVCTNPYILL